MIGLKFVVALMVIAALVWFVVVPNFRLLFLETFFGWTILGPVAIFLFLLLFSAWAGKYWRGWK
jgi:hypothetical protein